MLHGNPSHSHEHIPNVSCPIKEDVPENVANYSHVTCMFLIKEWRYVGNSLYWFQWHLDGSYLNKISCDISSTRNKIVTLVNVGKLELTTSTCAHILHFHLPLMQLCHCNIQMCHLKSKLYSCSTRVGLCSM